MAISAGERLPDVTLSRLGADGPETVELPDLLQSRNVALFAVPGAFTPTCSNKHMPGFIKKADALRAKGVDEIICVSVNDPFVLKAWEEDTGAGDAGILVLGDPGAEFTKAIGMDFSAPSAGLYDRSVRYSMYIVNGIVKALNVEESAGVCAITSGDQLLSQIPG